MRMSLAGARSSEVRVHLAVLALIMVGSALAAWRPGVIAALPLGCVLRNVTHIRCPFCGMTTDFVAMWQGHMPRENPFSIPFAVVIYLLYPAFLLYTVLTNQLHLFSGRKVQVAAASVAGVMWAANNLRR